MCRFWLTTGCVFSEKEIDDVKTKLLEFLKPGGPDNQKFLVSNNAYSFHSRLAIQDLSENSNQPLILDDGSILVFNSEILYWPELLQSINIDKSILINSDTLFLKFLFENNLIEKFINKFKGFFHLFILIPITKKYIFLSKK